MKCRHVLLLVAVLAAPVVAQPTPGGRAGSSFLLAQTAESASLGRARAALLLRDPDIILNPSLAPFQAEPSIVLAAGMYSLDRSAQVLSFATPLPPAAGIAVTIQRVAVTNIDGRDRNGVATGELQVAEHLAALSFGLRPAPALTLGVSAKLFYAQLVEGLTSTTVGLDVGATYLIADAWRVAAVFRDVNSKYRWDSTPVFGRQGRQIMDPFPRRTVFALAYSPEAWPVAAAVEAEAVAGGWIYRAGLDAAVHPMVRVRTGVDQVDPSGTLGTRWSGGAAIENTGFLWDPSIQYAYVVEPYAPGGAHLLTIRLHPRK